MAKRKLKHGTRDLAKSKRQVKLLSAPWDMGADGQANKARPQTVDDASDPEMDSDTGQVVRRNPNGVKRLRFIDMLDVYRGRGVISERGHAAGVKFRNAWAATQKGVGNDWSKERVDSTPKPDAAIAIMVDRVSALVKITRKIPPEDYRIIATVVGDGNTIACIRKYRGRNFERGKVHLRDALDRLADKMGI